MKEHRKQNRLDPHRFEFICIHCQAIFASKRNLDDHKVRIHPHSIPTVTSTIYQCTYCEYRSVLKGNFGKHMMKHSETANNYTFQTCLHCNAKFKTKAHLDRHLLTHPETPVAICSEMHMSEPPEKMNYNKFKVCVHCNGKFKNKASLDDHTIREHPGVVAYFSRQIHECAECPYKTFSEVRLNRHMVKHTKPVGSYNFSICNRCNTKYRSKQLLDEHIIRKHPDSIASVSSKIHECTRCTYQTAFKAQIAKHMAFKHSETVDNYNYKMCVHCDAKFKSNFALANHTIKKHPDYMGSVCHKIYDCALCPYKTVLKTHLDRHMLKHPECAASHNLIKCVHCDATYKSKQTMDDHIVRVHPKFIASISSKIHECKYCAYKTTAISNMKTHTIQHTKVSCMHCNLTFKSRTILDEHIIGKHPDFLASISGKLHECSHCTYKTVRKTLLYRHMLKHPDINS
ncbi:unnamed protein product [Callosobruchus maculatus]|nr:unnamed protein product [Callosobruchus maculatus]